MPALGNQRFSVLNGCGGGLSTVAAMVTMLSLVSDAGAQTINPPVTECDRLAGNTDDPMAVATGRLDNPDDAIAACERALREYPKTPRFLYQLGRAKYKHGYKPLGSALAFQEAAQLGYPAAMYELSRVYRSGFGFPLDRSEYRKWLGKAADAGYPAAKAELRQLGISIPKDALKAKPEPKEPERPSAGIGVEQEGLGRLE